MIEVLFLGVGAAIPAAGETNSSYLVRVGDIVILIDCGPAILQQLAAVQQTPSAITHVVFTHRHGDHTLGYPLFMLWWATEGKPPENFPITIAGEITWSSLDLLLQNTFGEVSVRARLAPRQLFPDGRAHTISLRDSVTLRTWPMEHSRFAPVSGVRLEAEGRVLAFTGDTMPHHNIVEMARGADLLVHDSAYSVTLNPEIGDGVYGHGTARSAGRHAAAAGVKHLALTHISARYAGQRKTFIAEAAGEFSGTITAPCAGDIYCF